MPVASLVASLGNWAPPLRSTWPIFLTTPLPSRQAYIHIGELPCSPLFSTLSNSSSQPLLLSPSVSSVAFCTAHSSMSMSLLYWAAQHWARHSRSQLGRAEGKGHLPRPAGSALPNAAQGAAGNLRHKGTSLAHGSLLPVFHRQQTCRGCTWPHYSGH